MDTVAVTRNVGGIICFGPEVFAFVIVDGKCVVAGKDRQEVGPDIYNAMIDYEWNGWVVTDDDRTTIGTC